MVTYFPKPLNKQVADISGSMSQTQDGLAIVANGNTHAAISSGQFVYVKNHDTLAEGLYKATSAIAANDTLSTSNLTPDGSGGLNDLQGQLTTLNSNISGFKLKNVAPNTSGVLELNFTRGDINAFAVLIGRFGYNSDKLSIAIISHQQSDIARVKCIGDETVTVTCTGNTVQVQMGHSTARCMLISNAI